MAAGITRTVTEQSSGTQPSSLLGNIGNALGLSTPAQAGGKRRRQSYKRRTQKKSKKGGKKSKKSQKYKKSQKSKKGGNKSRKSRK